VGRCGATSQRYSIRVTCRCVPGSSTMTRVTNITRGRGLRIDFAF
jgi:hypothetical protein